MKRKYSAIALFLTVFSFQSTQAQYNFAVTQCTSNSQVINLIDSVLLANVKNEDKKNISFYGDPAAIGYYTGGDIFGFENKIGICISTGFASTLDNSNTCSNENSSNNNGGSSDADLATIVGMSIYDAAVIEFDLLSNKDSVFINYVLGSEDYHDWVNSNFNDVFGFFLSGPGIFGPYSNNAINIATIPGTEIPVSINNINCGVMGTPCVEPPGVGTYCYLLYDNSNPNQSSFDQCVLDGYTFPLYASYNIQPEQWYHFKLALGDVNDALWDAALFIEKGTLLSDSLTTNIRKNSFYENIQIKPNPTRDYVEIQYSGKEPINEVLIYDVNGNMLKRQQFENGRISLSEIPKGMLFIEFKIERTIWRYKIIHF